MNYRKIADSQRQYLEQTTLFGIPLSELILEGLRQIRYGEFTWDQIEVSDWFDNSPIFMEDISTEGPPYYEKK